MRRILLLCLLVQVLLGSLAAKIYLAQHNTLHANGRWISTKTTLERSLMGAFAFVTERQSLAGGVLNLGAWHGFQEVLHVEPVAGIDEIEFDFRLGRDADLTVLFGVGPEDAASGVRFSTADRHPAAYLEIEPGGRFTRKDPLDRRTFEPGTWHRSRLVISSDRVTVSVDGLEIGSFARQGSSSGRFGFRGGGGHSVFVDDVRVRWVGGESLRESFDAPRSVVGLAAAVSTVLTALNIVLYLILRRAARDEKILLFSFLATNLTLLVIGALIFGFVLLRAGAYPGLGRALRQAEEAFGRGTVEEVVAAIRERHDESSETSAEGVERILFLGTSQTWGAGARRDGDAFVAVVESLLNASGRERRYECINAGFSSLRAADLVPILERDLLPLEPSMVFINLGTNDRATRGGIAASVRRMAELALDAGARVVLIKEANEPTAMDPVQKARHTDLEAVGAELGLPVIDMHAYLKRLQDTGFLWWDLVHLTSYGQRLVAEKLARDVASLEATAPAASAP